MMASKFPRGISVHDGSSSSAGIVLSSTVVAHQPAAGGDASGFSFDVSTGEAVACAISSQNGQDLTLAAGTSAGDHVVLVPNSTDGEIQCSDRPVTGVAAVTASGAVTGGSLTDGTATLSSGSLTDAVAVTASGAVTGGSLTDGTATLSSGNLTGAAAVTASGAVTGGSLTDGTATLSSGNLTGAAAVTASGTVTGGSLTDGTATLSSGNLTGAVSMTASGVVTGGSLTDGTATLSSGSLTDAVAVTASGTVTGGSLTDGTATLSSGSLTDAVAVTASGVVTGGSLTDGTATLSSGNLTGVAAVTASGTITAGGVSSTQDIDLNNNRVVNLSAPNAASDAATKSYVDNEVGRIRRKQPAETVVTSNLGAEYDAGSTTLTADANGAFGEHNGVTATDGDVVLVAAQTEAWTNGLYVLTDAGDGASPFVLTRTDDMGGSDEVEGALVHILGGDYADTEWRAAVGASFVMDDEGGDGVISFAQIQTNFVTAGDGLAKTATTLAVDVNNETDIDAALVDDDLLLVYDVSASATHKSALSRLPTYVNNHASITGFSNLSTVGTITSGTWSGSFGNSVVTTAALVNDAITSDKIADAAVATAALADDAVTSAKIASAAVDTAVLVDAAVTNAKIASDAVDTAALADDAVTSAKIADAAVATVALADDAVTSAKIADAAVDTAALADDAVTDAKIASGVAFNKLSAPVAAFDMNSQRIVGLAEPSVGTDAASKTYVDTAVTTSVLVDDAVTSAKIADDAVTSAKIASGAVTDAEVASGIAFSKLAAPAAAFDVNEQRVTNLGAPSAASDATTKTYVDAAVAGAGPSLGNFSFSGNAMTTTGSFVEVQKDIALSNDQHLILGSGSGVRESGQASDSQAFSLSEAVSTTTAYVGVITLYNGGSLNADSSESFTLSNAALEDGAYIFLQLVNGNARYFTATATDVGGSSATITLYNMSGTSKSTSDMKLMFWVVGPAVV